MAENIDLDDMNRVDDIEEEQGGQEETSFIEDNRIGDLIDPSIPNINRDVGVFKRAYTRDKKDFLQKELGVNINKGDGPNSSLVIDKMELTLSKDRTKVNGVRFNGVKVIVLKNGRMEYSEGKTKERVVNEFKELIKKVQEEHSSTPIGYIEERLANELDVNIIDDELADDVIDRSIESIVQEISNLEDVIVAGLSESELREFRAVLEAKIIDFLDIEILHWKDLARIESNGPKKKLYEAISQVAELKADELRLRQNQIPKNAASLEILNEELENSDYSRFERFKKWAKENLIGLSAVAISIAGIITTIVFAGRKAIRMGAKGVSSLAKSLAKLGKKLWPVLGAVLNLISNILTMGAKGIQFLANNLWVLAVLLASYFVYNKREYVYKKRNNE